MANIVQDCLNIVNGGVFKNDLINKHGIKRVQYNVVCTFPLVKDPLGDIEDTIASLRLGYSIYLGLSNDPIRNIETDDDMYKYIMSQMMTSKRNKVLVGKMMSQIILILLKKLLNNPKVGDRFITKSAVMALLKGEITESYNKFLGELKTGKESVKGSINNMGNDDMHWTSLKRGVYDGDGKRIESNGDFIYLKNEELDRIWSETIKDSGERYKVQKKIVRGIVMLRGDKEADQVVRNGIFNRHLLIVCIKSILFYEKKYVDYNFNGLMNYDYYQKNIDKINSLLAYVKEKDEEELETCSETAGKVKEDVSEVKIKTEPLSKQGDEIIPEDSEDYGDDAVIEEGDPNYLVQGGEDKGEDFIINGEDNDNGNEGESVK